MPVEIKELQIKAVIAASKDGGNASVKTLAPADLQKWKKEIIAECMEKVFRKLEEKQER
jgi:hypothetical protein